ncbi:hypothetical protein [Streptomyces sp. NPDC003247]|uniref:hypothetical protein n=1 Tax=Streptomyces sp. NPDC003247 TaxID=3364677 RepID=UPI00367CE531
MTRPAPAFAALDSRLTAAGFSDPGAADRPWVRWTLAPGASTAELEGELREMAATGIAGAEIGQGSFPSTGQLAALYRTANSLGITLSLSHGPVSAPDGFSIDDDQARKQLAYGSSPVGGGTTFSGALPKPSTTNRSAAPSSPSSPSGAPPAPARPTARSRSTRTRPSTSRAA